MTTLFISDLHLGAERPDIGARFMDFLDGTARDARALYILGDLFEAWVGDDDTEAPADEVISALRALTQSGTPCFLMHGNRDFLIGPDFAQRSGVQLLDEPTVIELYDERIALIHGDSLCTEDHEYQAIRERLRNPDWQREFLRLPLAERKAFARRARDASQMATSTKPMHIMDVSQAAVEALMSDLDVRCLLHGHTHRPNVHRFDLGGVEHTRLVLGDWYEQGSVLRWDEDGFELRTLGRDRG